MHRSELSNYRIDKKSIGLDLKKCPCQYPYEVKTFIEGAPDGANYMNIVGCVERTISKNHTESSHYKKPQYLRLKKDKLFVYVDGVFEETTEIEKICDYLLDAIQIK